MKVLMINGSPHEKGTTYTALNEISRILNENNIETEIVSLGTGAIRDCTGCLACRKLDNKCVFDDDVINTISEKAKTADGFIFGTPVYYAHPTGRLLSALDRIFYSAGSYFQHKPAAAIACARRAGTTASVDVLNKYLTIAQMPVVSSTYWNVAHGANGEDVLKDEEGIQTFKNLANNMIWLLNCIDAGKKAGITPPQADKSKRTNFIR